MGNWRGGQTKTPSPVTNRTKEGVIQRFTSRQGAPAHACTQVHAAAGCRPRTAGLPSSAAQLPVDAALNAHGLTLLILLLYAFFRAVSIAPLPQISQFEAFFFRSSAKKSRSTSALRIPVGFLLAVVSLHGDSFPFIPFITRVCDEKSSHSQFSLTVSAKRDKMEQT